jgi:hypothetical protein
LGLLDFISGLFGGGVPWRYKRLVKVFSPQMPICEDEAYAEMKLREIAGRLSKGNEKEMRAAKGLTAFIDKGGARYFVKKG